LKTFIIRGTNGDSTILIGERIQNLKKYISAEKIVVITDINVHRLYQKNFPSDNVIIIGTGEKIKNLDTVQYIYDKLMALEVERSSFIVGIGGGIVCDITGFVASTYLRGVRFGFVSTTLLSQVDASVGGKNGVNFGGYKNIIGVFNQPEFVICDLSLLGTLPGKEILCGLAEIVKHAVIGDAELFGYLEENYKNAFSLDRQVIERLVYDSIKIKSTIVNKDEKEKGERRKLNFGHTIGHAIEKTIGISHGEAVSAGMVAAATIAVNRNLLSPEDATRIKLLLKNLRLPTEILTGKERLIEALKKDKKREGDAIHFVLPDGIGKVIVKQIPIKEIKNMLTAAEAELSS
jgi:3-dehydroquinate synthase